MDWLDLRAVHGTLKSLLQHHSSKASILRRSAFLIVHLSHPHMTTGKTIALTRRQKLSAYTCSKPGVLNRPQRGSGWRREGVKALRSGHVSPESPGREAVSRAHLRRGPGEVGLKVGYPGPGWGGEHLGKGERARTRGWDRVVCFTAVARAVRGLARVPRAGRCAERHAPCLFVSRAMPGLGCGLWSLSSPTRALCPGSPEP